MSWKNVQYENGKCRTSESGGGGASALTDLSDVNISSASDGQVLKYDDATSKWVNANESSGGHTYSTSEQRIGTWIDGKPIYEKTISPLTTTSGIYALDISSLKINEIMSFKIFIHNTTGGDYAFGSYWEGNNDKLNWYMHSGKQTIYIRSASGYSYGTGWCVIQYTKTTD